MKVHVAAALLPPFRLAQDASGIPRCSSRYTICCTFLCALLLKFDLRGGDKGGDRPLDDEMSRMFILEQRKPNRPQTFSKNDIVEYTIVSSSASYRAIIESAH